MFKVGAVGEIREGNRVHRGRVMVPLGRGTGEVALVIRRIDDGRRVILFRGGEVVEAGA